MDSLKYTLIERRYLKNKGALKEDTEPENDFMWYAYMVLRRSKSENGHVPISEIKGFCDLFRIEEPSQIYRLMGFIAALGNVELEYVNNRP